MGLLDAVGSLLSGFSGQGGGGYQAGPRRTGDLPLDRAVLEGFRGSGMVYRCVNIISGELASLNLGMVNAADQGGPDIEHPTAALFNKTTSDNPHNALVMKATMWQQLELTGQSFLRLDRGPSGEGDVVGVRPVYWPVEVIVDSVAGEMDGQLLGFRIIAYRGQRFPVLPSEMLWLRYPDPGNPWGCVSPLRAAAWAADLDAYARQWQAGEFRRGARPGGVIFLGDVSNTQRDQIRQEFASEHEGPRNAGKHLFLWGKTQPKYERITLTPAEMSYIQSRKVNAEDIRDAYGVGDDLVRGSATYENQRQAKINLWTVTLLPKLQFVEAEIDRILFPLPTERAQFDISKVEALREQTDAIAKRSSLLFRSGILARREARLAVGYEEEPLPDDIFIPLAPVPMASPKEGGSGLRTRAKGKTVAPAVSDKQKDRLAANGARAIVRLADKQERVVLRKLEAAMSRTSKAAGRDASLGVLIGLDEIKDRGHWTNQVRVTVDELFDRTYWANLTEAQMSEFFAQVYDAGGQAMADALGIDYSTLSHRIDAIRDTRLTSTSAGITNTTRDALAAALEAQDPAATLDVVSAAVQAVFGDLGGGRSDLIGRTEALWGLNNSALVTAQQSGVVESKTWVTAGDDRVDQDCEDLDGETVPVDAPFSSGDDAPPLHPDCRCTLTFETMAETESALSRPPVTIVRVEPSVPTADTTAPDREARLVAVLDEVRGLGPRLDELAARMATPKREKVTVSRGADGEIAGFEREAV